MRKSVIPVPADVRAYFQKEFLDEKHRHFDDVFAPFVLGATDFRDDAYIGLSHLYSHWFGGRLERQEGGCSYSERPEQPHIQVAEPL